MKSLYSLFIIIIIVLSSHERATAQGCVAVRNIVGGSNGFLNESKTWQLSANYRFFHSYKHFVGMEEQTHRVEENTNVINNDHSILLGANYNITNRFSAGITVPLIYINRTSLYEHYGNSSGQRFGSSSKGIGDIRLIANYMLVDKPKTKLQIGLGVKLPTGNYRYQDYFHKQGSQDQDTLELRYVDQSIQPGDGGFGVLAAFDGAFIFNDVVSAYATGMYLSNPRNSNGVVRSNNLTNDANGNPIPFSNEFSVADQYFVRAGARFRLSPLFELSLGGRIECVTSHDIIGREDGFRRPGYIVSVDPAIFYVKGNHILGLNVPVALIRNRTRNTTDILRGINNNPNSGDFGKPFHGDAAFADFLVSVSYALRINKKVSTPFGTGSEVVK